MNSEPLKSKTPLKDKTAGHHVSTIQRSTVFSSWIVLCTEVQLGWSAVGFVVHYTEVHMMECVVDLAKCVVDRKSVV